MAELGSIYDDLGFGGELPDGSIDTGATYDPFASTRAYEARVGQDTFNASRASELKKKELFRKGKLQYEDNGELIHDSNNMIRAKETFNTGLSGVDWLLEASENIADYGQGDLLNDTSGFMAENQGKKYHMNNKDMIAGRESNIQDLISQYQTAEHNPNADKGVYTLKKFDGYNTDGSDKFLYKYGLAEIGADNRYEGYDQDVADGYEIVEEKRFAGAEDWEKTWNANQDVLNARAIDSAVANVNGQIMSRDKASGINFGSGYTELLDRDLLGTDVGKTQEDYDRNREHSKRLSNAADARYKSGMSNSAVDAFQSGAASLVVDTADFLLDVFTVGDNTMLNDVKKKENIDKWVGYDRTQSTQVLSDAADYLQQGDYFKAVTTPLTDVNTMVESLPMMIGMVFGSGKFTAVSKAIKAVESAEKSGRSLSVINRAKSIAKANMTSKQAKMYDKYKDSTTMIKGLDHLAKNAGFHTIVGAMTNNVLDDRIAEKVSNGEKGEVGMDEVLGVYAMQLPLLMIDKLAFTSVVGLGSQGKALKQAFKSLAPTEQSHILTKVLAKGASVTATGGAEGIQEYAQTWGEILGAKAYTGEHEFFDVFEDKDSQREALIGGLGGVGAGAQIKAIVDAPSNIKSTVETIGDINTRRQLKNLSDNELDFTREATQAQIIDITEQNVALNEGISDMRKELREDKKSGTLSPEKIAEYKNLVSLRDGNNAFLKQNGKLSKLAQGLKSKKKEQAINLEDSAITDVDKTTQKPILKDISQIRNQSKLFKSLNKHSSDDLLDARNILSKTPESSAENATAIKVLDKAIIKRKKAESKVFTDEDTTDLVKNIDTQKDTQKISQLSRILKSNRQLEDESTADRISAIINQEGLLTPTQKVSFTNRLNSLKKKGYSGETKKETPEPEIQEEFPIEEEEGYESLSLTEKKVVQSRKIDKTKRSLKRISSALDDFDPGSHEYTSLSIQAQKAKVSEYKVRLALAKLSNTPESLESVVSLRALIVKSYTEIQHLRDESGITENDEYKHTFKLPAVDKLRDSLALEDDIFEEFYGTVDPTLVEIDSPTDKASEVDLDIHKKVMVNLKKGTVPTTTEFNKFTRTSQTTIVEDILTNLSNTIPFDKIQSLVANSDLPIRLKHAYSSKIKEIYKKPKEKGKKNKPRNLVSDIDSMKEVEYKKAYPKVKKNTYVKRKKIPTVTKGKPTVVKDFTDKARGGKVLSIKSLSTLSPVDQHTVLSSTIAGFLDDKKSTKSAIVKSIKNSSLSNRVRDVLLYELDQKNTELGAVHGIKEFGAIELKRGSGNFDHKDQGGEQFQRGKPSVKKIVQSDKRIEEYVSEVLTDERFLDAFARGSNISDSTNNKQYAKQDKAWNLTTKQKAVRTNFLEDIASAVRGDRLPQFPSEDPLSVSKATRFATIALGGIIDSMRSNIDLTNSSKEDGAELTRHYATRQDTLKEAGRKFIHSYGQNVVPKEGSTDSDVSSYYIKLGEVGLDVLDTIGYLGDADSKYDSDKGVLKHFGMAQRIDTEGQFVKQDLDLASKDVIFLKGVSDLLEDSDVSKEGSTRFDTKYDPMLSPILSALNPASRKDPLSHKPKGSVHSDSNEISTLQENTIKDIQNESLEIDNDFYDLLKEVVEISGTKSISQLSKSESWVRNLFGLNIAKSGLEIFKNEENGVVISRQSHADSMLNHIRELEDDTALDDYEKRQQFFTVFSARNNRLHLENVSFDYQADKIVSRFIMGSKYTTKSEKDNLVLISAVSETLTNKSKNFHITPEDILSPQNTEASKKLEDLLITYSNEGIKALLESKVYDSDYNAEILKNGDSVAEIISALQAVLDIRNTVLTQQKANPDKELFWQDLRITSNFNPEFDASASGIMNKNLNYQGFLGTKAISKADQKKAKDAGEKVYKTSTDFDRPERMSKKLDSLVLHKEDAYIALVKEIMALIDKSNAMAKNLNNPKTREANKATSSILQFIASSTTPFDIKNPDHKAAIRNTAKYPVMTNSYGQKIDSLKLGLGQEIGKELMIGYLKGKKGEVDYDNAIMVFTDLGIKLSDVQDNSKSYKMIASKVGDNFGTIVGKGLTILNADLNAAQKVTQSAYEQLVAGRSLLRDHGENHTISMRNPFDVTMKALGEFEGEIDPNTNFVIEKLKLTEQDMTAIAEEAGVVPTKLMLQANSTSSDVVPLHAMDSAILLIAYNRTFKYFKEKGIMKGLGTMAIHDAVKGTPEFLLEFKKQYHTATLDVAQYYDLITEIKNELEYTLEKAVELSPDSSTVNNLRAAIKTVSINTKQRLEFKEKKINELRADPRFQIFGDVMEKSELPIKPIDTTNYNEYGSRDFGTQSKTSQERTAKSSQLHKVQQGQKKPRFTPKVRVVDLAKRLVDSQDHYDSLKSLVDSGKPFVVLSTKTSEDRQIGQKEVLSLTASIRQGTKEIGKKTLSLLPSDEITYEQNRNKSDNTDVPHSELEIAKDLEGKLEYTYTDSKGVEAKGYTRDQDESSKAIDSFMESLNETVKGIDSSIENVSLVGHDILNKDSKILSNTSKEFSKQKFKLVDTLQAFNTYNKITQSKEEYNPNKPESLTLGSMSNEFGGNESVGIDQLTGIVDNFNDTVKSSTNSFLYDFQSALKTEDKALKIKEANNLLDSIEDTDTETKVYIDNIKSALEADNSIVSGEEFKFNIKDDQIFTKEDITFSDTKSFLKYIDHEVQHSVTAKYIGEQFNDPNKQNNSFKALGKVYSKLNGRIDVLIDNASSEVNGDVLGQSVRNRLIYIKSREGSGTDSERVRAMSEFVAIYRSNQEFRDYLGTSGLFSDSMVKTVMKAIKDILTSAYKAITGEQLSSITMGTFNQSLDNIIFESVSSSKKKGKKKESGDPEPLGAVEIKGTEQLMYNTMKNVQEGCE